MTNTKDTAGVIAPPPLIYLTGLLLGGVIGWFYPVMSLPNAVRYVLGGVLIAFGLGIVYLAKRKMTKAKTNIEPWKPTTAILSDGIYGHSRNPIYAALVIIYCGAALFLDLIWSLPLLIPVLFVIHFGVIKREEKYLENKFGGEYLTYRKRVRRWI
ncbi:MAG: isoprenylcysteine carboxylmethyltransferase family protein [Acidobacteria bacterium]|nr:isoprenylcysteine carboxylmethyltransferase family protein [Acidobacteriota bacterium]